MLNNYSHKPVSGHPGEPDGWSTPEDELATTVALATGGDSRLTIGADGGLSKYGCATRPLHDVTAFGSCTASSVSAHGHARAVQVHRTLSECSPWAPESHVLESAYEGIRRELAALLGLDGVSGTEVVLSPSGTDVELMALALAHGDGARPLWNIVIAPTEVGSGTVHAAGGRYFDSCVPSASPCTLGEAVCESLSSRTSVKTVAVRSTDGSLRDETELDGEVTALVAEAIGKGARVLLHVVAHSKTGVHAPSQALIMRLKEQYGNDVKVVLDAAQARVDRRTILAALAHGHMVFVTGSKFFSGPTFSGALLVPSACHPDTLGVTALPSAFGHFYTAGQLPRSWLRLRNCLPRTGNVGLVLRWSAALAEMRRYYEIPSEVRLAVMWAFEQQSRSILGSSPLIEMEGGAADEREHLEWLSLETATTVLPFTVAKEGVRGSELANKASLTQMFHWLYRDVSALVPSADEHERKALSARVHIGQPVALGDETRGGRTVLRVALGSAMIAKVAGDSHCGASLGERIDWMTGELHVLRNKIETISRHLESMRVLDQPVYMKAA